MFRFYLFILISICFSTSVFSQQDVSGKVIDFGNETPIEHAKILSKKGEISVESEENGSFFLSTLNLVNFSFFISGKQFYWSGNTNGDLQIVLSDLQGRIIYSLKTTDFSGQVELDYSRTGYYLLKLSEVNSSETHKLFGSETGFQNQTFNISNSPIDSIYIEAEGYYSKKFSTENNSLSNYLLLKKNYDSNIDYFTEVPDYSIFKLLQSDPRKTNLGEVETVKALYDFKDDKIYYINSEKYLYHYTFASQKLEFKISHVNFNNTQYSNNEGRKFYLFTINFNKSQGKYVMEFFGGDDITCEQMSESYHKVASTSYFKEKLYLLNNHPRLDSCKLVPIIGTEELYEGLNYQPLSLEKSYGYLKSIDIKNLEKEYLGKRDIIILNSVPNDVSVVAGIITTEFQTPLSHINVLSHNRKTPNMGLSDALTNKNITALVGSLVYMEVKADTFTLRKATLEEAEAFWLLHEPSIAITLEKDTTDKGLIDFKNVTRADVNKIGGKAANFSILYNYASIPNPENAFAIPFVHYERHLKNNHIDLIINELLKNEEFNSNFDVRKEKLAIVQRLIENAPIDPELITLVRAEIHDFRDFDSYKFRSSTNAEDLEVFSGAGLYASYAATKDSKDKTIENAIRKVWSSLWNIRAFEEREYYKIDHKSIAMGVLVHRSFPDEVANGVIVTRNLYNSNSGIIINVQYGEESVVYPAKGTMTDEIMIYYYSTTANSSITYEYLSRSNRLPEGQKTVLTNSELEELAKICYNLKLHYFYKEEHNCNCEFRDFALDIEFKIAVVDGKRKIYIKQVRPYQ